MMFIKSSIFALIPVFLVSNVNAMVASHRRIGADRPPQYRLEEYSGLFTLKNQAECNAKRMPSSKTIAVAHKQLSPILADILSVKEAILKFEASGMNMMKEETPLEELLSNVLKHVDTTCNELLGSSSVLEEPIRNEISKILKSEVQPLMKTSEICRRSIEKPRGYAGDFQAIDIIYKNEPKGTSIVGDILDRYCLDMVASKAVRNRRYIFSHEIESLLLKHSSSKEPLQVTSMACGPAREVQDVFLNAEGKFPNIECHLIDFDKGALGAAKGWMDHIPDFPYEKISMNQKNPVHLMRGKESLDIPLQDLIYSAGIIDYFKDSTIVRLLNYAYDNLNVGGKLMLGNFHESNPMREWMDSILEWKLIHRNEEQMNNLFMKSKFAKPCEIIFDETGVQMVAVCEKD